MGDEKTGDEKTGDEKTGDVLDAGPAALVIAVEIVQRLVERELLTPGDATAIFGEALARVRDLAGVRGVVMNASFGRTPFGPKKDPTETARRMLELIRVAGLAPRAARTADAAPPTEPESPADPRG